MPMVVIGGWGDTTASGTKAWVRSRVAPINFPACLPWRVSFLPQEIRPAEHRPVGAGEPPTPLAAREGYGGGVRFAHADATTLAGAHPAGHRPLHGHLALNPARGRDVGHPFH